MNSFVEKMFSLKEKVIVVTGASKGIGFAIADALGKSGAHVYGIARSVKARLENDQFEYISCDVTKLIEIEQLFSEIFIKHSRIDVLVNAAGISISNNSNLPKQKIENFRKTFKINTEGPFNTIVSVCENMKKNNSGSIINITSIGAEFGFPGNPGYLASKGALKMLTKGFAEDLAEFGIRVNNIAPGYIYTDMTSKSYNDKVLHQTRLRNTMLKRWGTPEDIIGAAIYLSSDASSYVTGTDLLVDGGWSAKGMV
jgi:NAD(P)-dependent dehydrogenase (short-subunit alcohol dehydrogenase family)